MSEVSSKKMKQVQVKELPDCDICTTKERQTPAKYDAPTSLGFAYLCEDCFQCYGYSDGATQLVKIEKREPKKRFDKIPTVSVPLTLDSVATVYCPHCGESRDVEPDADYTVECESCGEKYRVISPL